MKTTVVSICYISIVGYGGGRGGGTVNTHSTFLFSLLRTVRPKGLCEIVNVSLMGTEGWLVTVLTCS